MSFAGFGSLIIFVYRFNFACLILSIVHGEFDANFTLQNVWGRLPNSGFRSIIQCISSDGKPNKIKFSRAVDTGQGLNLPRYSQQFLQGEPVFARILLMPNGDGLSRFGAFQCEVTTGGVTTQIVALKLPPFNLVEIDSSEPYKVVNQGDEVILEMKELKDSKIPVQWRHNGGPEIKEWNGHLRVKIEKVQVSDAGIYECYYDGNRKENVHGILKLIVRGCPGEKYGPFCDKDCPSCYNGGICHDIWGVCVCPAGFTGLTCEIPCGGNHFGADCTKLCSPVQNNSNMDDGCVQHLFCKPDPYGCSCAPGFKGANCSDHCEPGKYGADCKQLCHCANNTNVCNRITGVCNGECAQGWKGISCHIPDSTAMPEFIIETSTPLSCDRGKHGIFCNNSCHCMGELPCDVHTGACPDNKCDVNWTGSACNECINGKFGDNCEFTCHCSGGDLNCDKEGFCKSGCEAGWTGFTCQQACTSGRFGQNCGLSCHCYDGPDVCDKISGYCSGDCEAGYMGSDCQTYCPFNLYGVNCQHSCLCENGGNCNKINGTCVCQGRWKGDICTESVPQIVAAPDEEVNVNQNIFISCTGDAIPPPKLQMTSSHFSGLVTKVRDLEKNQFQVVAKVSFPTAGNIEFYCTARNDHGFDTKTFILSVIDPPVLRERPQILKVDKNIIKVGWRPWEFGKDDGGKESDRVDYMVLYRKVGNSNWNTTASWQPGLSVVIQNLDPYTEYEFSVKCKRFGKGGDGKPSDSITAKTLCGASTPRAIPQNFLQEMITSTSVQLSWKPPLLSDLRCSLKIYKLCYYESTDVSNIQYVDISRTSTVYTLRNLQPNTEYTLHLYADSEFSPSKQFAELIIHTLESLPGPVENVSFQHLLDPSLLIVRWDEPSITRGTIKNYIVMYQLLNRGLCNETLGEKQNITTNEKQVTLLDLFSYSIYMVIIHATTRAGPGEEESYEVITNESVPSSSPQNIQTLTVSESKIEFIWEPVHCEEMNGQLFVYEFGLQLATESRKRGHILTRRDEERASWIIPLTKVRSLTALVVDLEPYQEYAFIVRAYTKVGPGPFSSIFYQRTASDVPAAPIPVILIAASEYFIINWEEPFPCHGPIVEYKLHIWPTKSPLEVKELVIKAKESLTCDYETSVHYNVTNLSAFTQYSLKMQASTVAGWGNWSDVLTNLTKEGVSSVPHNLTLASYSDTSIKISWLPPDKTNGKLLAYEVICELAEKESSLSVSTDITTPVFNRHFLNSNTLTYTITDLKPETKYKISVRGSTSAGHGISISGIYKTASPGILKPPEARILESGKTNSTIPIIFAISNHSNVMKYQIIVEDSRNANEIDEDNLTNYSIAMENRLPYYIAAELKASDLPNNGSYQFLIGNGNIYEGFTNVHLNPGLTYKFWIRIAVKLNQEIKYLFSQPTQAILDVYHHENKLKQGIFGMHIVYFILILLGVFVFLTIITFFIVLCICRRREMKRILKKNCSPHHSSISDSMTYSVSYKVSEAEAVDSPLVTAGQPVKPNQQLSFIKLSTKKIKQIKKGDSNNLIHVHDLPDYIYNKSLDCNGGFLEEYNKLIAGQTALWTIGKKSDNIRKNRYGNILPYDHNRVVLKQLPDIPSSDYINASYIDGYNKPKEYIITQGPKDKTVEDFWRMVFQENSCVIIMITGLMENKKRKCAKYWADDTMTCGNIQILLIHIEHCTDYTIRTILLRHLSTGDTQRVHHYQFLDWPDQSIPHNTISLLSMQRRVRTDNPNMIGPIIIHCSAGIGRSGSYVAIDILKHQAEEEKKVDFFNTVNQIRLQRIDLIHTMEQYKFVHEVISDAVNCYNTAISAFYLPSHFKELCSTDPKTKISGLEEQFKNLTRLQRKLDISQCLDALNEANIFKNRDPMIVPTDSARLKLLSCDDQIQTNYINAVSVDGYKHKSAFLVTQAPLSYTVEDFWRMVYDYKSSFIVMLNNTTSIDDLMDVYQYWPNDGCAKYGPFEVQVVTFEDQGSIMVRTMKLINTNLATNKPHRVIHLQYNDWKESNPLPSSPKSIVSLLNCVERWYRRTTGGPITVHCLDGSTRSGVFCAVHYIADQLKTEHIVDVFQVVKQIRNDRAEFLQNMVQFHFCFQVAQEIVESFSAYCNLNLSC